MSLVERQRDVVARDRRPLLLDPHDLAVRVVLHDALARLPVQQAVQRLLGSGDPVAVGIGRPEQLQREPLRVDALRLGHERDRAGVQVVEADRVRDQPLDRRIELAREVDEAVACDRRGA